MQTYITVGNRGMSGGPQAAHGIRKTEIVAASRPKHNRLESVLMPISAPYWASAALRMRSVVSENK